LISFEFSNAAASKTETNRDNTNRETGNPDIHHPGPIPDNAEKMETDQIQTFECRARAKKSMPSPVASILKPLELSSE
jgi:hypothetical protein